MSKMYDVVARASVMLKLLHGESSGGKCLPKQAMA